jgi:hypothetical protein
MPRFKSREEYEAWKAGEPGNRPAPADAAAPGFSVAKQKPRMWLTLPAAIVLLACAVFLYATGDRFSGTFVLAGLTRAFNSDQGRILTFRM